MKRFTNEQLERWSQGDIRPGDGCDPIDLSFALLEMTREYEAWVDWWETTRPLVVKDLPYLNMPPFPGTLTPLDD